MRSLDALTAAQAQSLQGVIFDLDDTFLTAGKLTLEAYQALFALRASGLRLVACTGRGSGWGAVIVRQWPLDLAVTENGAVLLAAPTPATFIERVSEADRKERRGQVRQMVQQLRGRFPELVFADDNDARRSDTTFDIGEHQHLDWALVRRVRQQAHRLGARTFASSVHLHLTLDTDDKASGCLYGLASQFGEDPTAALHRYAYIGDSANDAACFAAFWFSFGVSNVRNHLTELSVGPRFVSTQAQGQGFAEIARRLVKLRVGHDSPHDNLGDPSAPEAES